MAVVEPTLQTASDRSHFAGGVFSASRFSNVEDILPIESNFQHMSLKGVTGTQPFQLLHNFVGKEKNRKKAFCTQIWIHGVLPFCTHSVPIGTAASPLYSSVQFIAPSAAAAYCCTSKEEGRQYIPES